MSARDRKNPLPRLLIVLLGITLMAFVLGQLLSVVPRLPLRRLHLHLNLLGFIGLSALGTWRVLLPTVGRFGDPNSSGWLQQQWKPLTADTLLIAIGAAWWSPLSIAGLLLWVLPLRARLGVAAGACGVGAVSAGHWQHFHP